MAKEDTPLCLLSPNVEARSLPMLQYLRDPCGPKVARSDQEIPPRGSTQVVKAINCCVGLFPLPEARGGKRSQGTE